MTILDDLRASIVPLARSIVADFGDTVTVYRAAQTARQANTPVTSYAADATLVNVRALLLTPDRAAKQFPFGLTDSCTMFLLLPAQASGMPAVAQFDGVKITSGPYAGALFIADAAGAPDTFGANLGVALIQAPSGAVMA